MKKFFIVLLIILSIIIMPKNVFASSGKVVTGGYCEHNRDNTQTCYVTVDVSGSTRYYGSIIKIELENLTLVGDVVSANNKFKVTGSSLDNVKVVSENGIKSEKVTVLKLVVRKIDSGKNCRLNIEPKKIETDYSCSIANGYYYDRNGNSVSQSEYNNQCNPTCTILDGKYYDKDGKQVSKDEYSISCEKHSCEKIGDTFFDKDGKQVSKDEYSVSCEKHSCEIVGDTFFDKDGKQVSKTDYSISCEKHSCEIVGDTFFDKDGKQVSKTDYSKSCEKHSCEILDGVYYGSDGSIITDVEYDKQCNVHYCKIIDNTYFGKYGDIITKEAYASQCPSPNPKTGISETLTYVLLSTLCVSLLGVSALIVKNKKNKNIVNL